MVVCTFLSMNCYDTEYDVLRPRTFPPFWFGGVTSGLIRDSESRILEKTDQSDSSTENRINSLRTDFLKEVKDLKMITKEHHVLFVQEVKKVREDVNMQIRELREEMTKEVKNIHQGFESAHQKIDIICDAVVQCVKMFEQLNPQMVSLSANEVQHFGELVNLLKELKEISSKSSSSIISQEFLSQKFLNFEAILQKHLTSLLRISSLLPNVSDAPPTVTRVQGGEKSVQAKAGEHGMKTEDSKAPVKPTIVNPSKTPVKPTIVSASPVISTMTTTVPIPRPSTKGIVIGNVVSSNVSSSKSAAPSNVKDKGKGVLIEKTNKEKKAEVAAEVERMRHVESIMRQRALEGLNVDKGDPSKVFNYETIESRVMFDHMYSFEKIPKKSYVVTNTDYGQLDFPINEMMFVMPQFKAESKNMDVKEGNKMKIRFHAVLAKAQEEVWYLEKIKKVISIKRDVIFEGKFQNLKYVVTRASGKIQEFTIADFPLMNTYDLINVALILKDKSFSYLQETEPDVFNLGCRHIKVFLENYFECLAQTDIELAIVKGIDITAPMAPTKKQVELKKYEDGEICLKPLGIVFAGKDKAGRAKRFLFQTSEVERYTNSQYTNLIVRMNHCKKNSEGDKKEIKKVISWYMEIRRVLMYAVQLLTS
ncbi:hypothetical protein Lser_V15G11463 [Lactuca serriola]